MALFNSGPDVAAPIVNQLMQVDLDDMDELESLSVRAMAIQLASYRKHNYPENGKEVWQLILEPSPVLSERVAKAIAKRKINEDFKAREELELRHFQSCCKYGSAIIRSINATQEFPKRAIRRIFLYAAQAGSWHVTKPPPNETGRLIHQNWQGEGRKEDGETYYPFSEYSAFDSIHEPTKYVAIEIKQTLRDLRNGTSRLEVCPECRNIFVASTGKRTYCSLRCGRRVQQRQHRKKLIDVRNGIDYAMVK